MLTYEKAEELKEAGFIQDGKGEKLFQEITHMDLHLNPNNPIEHKASYVYVPTLSELIEACGGRFASLIKKNGGWESSSKFFKDEEGVINSISWIGITPEESVANLWLALNKK